MFGLYELKTMVVEKVYGMIPDVSKNYYTKERIEMEVLESAKIEFAKDYSTKVYESSFSFDDVEWLSSCVYSFLVENNTGGE